MRRVTVTAVLGAAAAAASFRAWTGDPVLDDLGLLGVLRRNPGGDGFVPPERWQPLVRLTLRAVSGPLGNPFGAAGLVHHLVSLGLFLGTVLMLAGVHRARTGGESMHPWHAFVLGAFALHPSLVEAYGHLAGRGEALALAALAGVALGAAQGRMGVSAAFAAAGLASSPVVAPAAAALVLAAHLDDPARVSRRSAAAIAAMCAAAVAAALAPGHGLGDVARWVARAPIAVGLATRSIAVPTETALRLPHWELSRPLTASIAAFAAVPAALAALAWGAGRRGDAVRVAGAALSVLPLVQRADALAYGFDRFVAGAAVLGAVTLLGAPPPAWTASLRGASRYVVASAAVGLLGMLGFMEWQTAQGFASSSHQLDAMTQMRSRDPSGHLRNAWFATRVGDAYTAHEALAAARRGPLTPQMARRADAIAAALHRR